MFCESCGHEVENSDKYCPYCGKPVVTGQEETIYLANEEKGQEVKALTEMPDNPAEEYGSIKDYGDETVTEDIQDIYRPESGHTVKDDIQDQEVQNIIPIQKKWPGRLLTGMLITAVIVLAVNIAVGLIYLHQLESQDDNYELPELNITESGESSI